MDPQAKGQRQSWLANDVLRDFEAAFATRTRDERTSIFEGAACVTPVLSTTEAPRHPHNRAREAFAARNGSELN